MDEAVPKAESMGALTIGQRPACHLVTRDGERVLVGGVNGAVALLTPSGGEVWRFDLRDRIEALACTAEEPRLYVVGTWRGDARAYVDEGLEWERSVCGVVGAIAVAPDRSRIAVGTWTGDVSLFRRDGTPSGTASLGEAVVALAIHVNGALVVAALADGTLVGLASDASEVWRVHLDGRTLTLAALDPEIFVATDAGTLMWLDEEGAPIREVKRVEGGIVLAATSRDGAWVAWVDRQRRLAMWQPDRKSGWGDVELDGEPDFLAVTGHGDGAFCNVALSSGRLLTYSRRQKKRETALPARVRDLAFSGAGTLASATSYDGESLYFVELTAVKDWLPPPRLVHRVTPGDLVAGEVGTLTVDISNEGGLAAHDVHVQIGGDFVEQAQSERKTVLASNKGWRLKKPIEPKRSGDVPVAITIRYRDEIGNDAEVKDEVFVRVAPRREGR